MVKAVKVAIVAIDTWLKFDSVEIQTKYEVRGGNGFVFAVHWIVIELAVTSVADIVVPPGVTAKVEVEAVTVTVFDRIPVKPLALAETL